MKEKINSSFNENKKDDNNIINPIYSTNNLSKKISENKTNQKQNNFLGKKRKILIILKNLKSTNYQYLNQ